MSLAPDGSVRVDTPQTSPIIVGRAGQAYDKAVADGVDPAERLAIGQQFTQMRQAFETDPKAKPEDWLKTTADFATKWKTDHPGPLGDLGYDTALRVGNQHYAGIMDAATKQDLANSKAAITTELTTAQNTLYSIARQGGTSTPEYQDALGRWNAAYDKLKTNSEMFGIAPASVDQQQKDAQIELIGHGLIGSVDRIVKDPGPNGGIAKAEELAKSIPSDPRFKELSQGEQTRLQTLVETRVQFNREENKRLINGNAAAASAIISGYTKGEKPDDQTFLTIHDNAVRLGDVDAVAQMNAARQAYEARRPLASLGVGGGVGNLGVVNQVYRGDPNAPGPNGGPSAAGLYSYYISKGASRNEAVLLTGAAASESGLDPTAVHDEGTGYGLFGHRLERRDAMFASAGSKAPNWQQQADFALKELRSRPEGANVNSATTPEQLAAAQMHFERPQGYTSDTPTAGLNYTGRLNTIRRFSSLDGSAPIPEVTPPNSVAIPFTPDQIKQNPYLVAAAYRQFDADKSGQVQVAQQFASGIGNMMRQGITPTVPQMAQVAQAAQQFPRELGTTAQDLMTQYAGHTGGAAAAMLPEGEGEARRAQVESYVRANPSIAGVNFLKAYNDQLTADTKRRTDEPQQYAARVGWRDRAPAPLTPEDPQAFAAQISDRVAGAHFIASSLHQAPEQLIFGAQDKSTIAGFLQAAPGPQARAAMQTLIGGLSTAAANELFKNKDSDISKAVIGLSKSDDPDKIDAGFAAMDAQQRRNPAQFREQFPKEDARLHDYQSRLSYYSKDEIAKQNLKHNDPSQATAVAAKENIANEYSKQWTADQVAKEFGSGITSYIPGLRTLVRSIPDAPPEFDSAKGAMLADFQMLYRNGFVESGDQAQALTYAKERLATKYSVSDVNNNRVMAFAPEASYKPINGTHHWISGQLDEFVQKNIAPSDASMGATMLPPTGIGEVEFQGPRFYAGTTAEQTAYNKRFAARMLFSDEDTQAKIAAGKQPDYAVIASDPQGRAVALTGTDGKPLRFTPDYNRAIGEWNAVQTGRHPAAQRGNAAAIEAAADPMRGGG